MDLFVFGATDKAYSFWHAVSPPVYMYVVLASALLFII
jgi:hypothetical protein